MTVSRNPSKYILIITAVAALGGFLFGYDTGVIGGTQLYFSKYFELGKIAKGWAVGSALYGCLFGSLIAGFLSERLSRKYALILSAFLFSISAWGSGIPDATSPNALALLIFFRVVGGIGVGIASMVAPIYISEVSPPAKRGQLVSYYQLAVVLGFFLVFLVTYFVGGGDVKQLSEEAFAKVEAYNISQGWRVMFWSELVPAISFLLLLFIIPHSPRWLMMRGRTEDANAVLKKISTSDDEAQQLMEEIQTSIDTQKQQSKNLSILFGKAILPILLIGIALSVLQQVTGINAILYYGAEIFEKTLGYKDPLKQQLVQGAVNFIATFIAIFTVDKWGRKPLLIVGVIGMFLGITTLGATIYFEQKGFLSLFGMLTFIASFALSMGPVVWVMLSEIFPNHIRSMAMSVAVAAQWLFNGIVANVFPIVTESTLNKETFHGGLPYFIFGAFCLLTIGFVLKFVPETKGRSLEEMDQFWKKHYGN